MESLATQMEPASPVGDRLLTFGGSPEQQQALDDALAKAFGQFDSIEKDREGQYGYQRFKYATLGQLIAATRPALSANGIVVMQFFNSIPGEPQRQRLTTMVRGHGAYISSSLDFSPREVREEGNKSFEWIKEYGKIRTYLRRYEYQCILGLDAEPDADEAALPRDEPRREAPRPQQRQERRPEPEPRPVQHSARSVANYAPSEPARDELADKLSTVKQEPTVEPEDGPADQDVLDELLKLQRALGMGKIQLADMCESVWKIPPGSIRQSMRAAKTVEQHMRSLLVEREREQKGMAS